MRCPNCGNEIYEMLDYAIARCTNCYSLWDPFIYPGFPTPVASPGQLWDTSEPEEEDLDEEYDGVEEEELDSWDMDSRGDEEDEFEEDWEQEGEEDEFEEDWEQEDEEPDYEEDGGDEDE